MTSNQRYAHTSTLTAAVLAAGALYAWHQNAWLPAAAFAYSAALLTWVAHREYTLHRRLLEEREWARRAAIDNQPPPPLDPCCPLWRDSGTVHAPNCTRVRFEEQIAHFYDDHQDGAA